MSAGVYLLGFAVLAVGWGALIWGAVRLRATLLPRSEGAPARLAEAIIALGVAVGISEVLGTVGVFRRGPVYAGFLVFAVVVRFACPAPAAVDTAVESARVRPALRRGEVAAATFGVVLVVGQWTTQLVDTFRRGMTAADTLWYHGPHAVRFLQDGSITQLLGRSRATETYYSSNSELIYAIVMLPFHRDFLSPLVSLGWMLLLLLAAWCLGRDRGIAPTCTLGAAMILSLPMLAGTQVGQMTNDVSSVALLLAAVALLLNDPRSRAATGLAAVAGGLAIATKPTVGVALIVISAGVLITAFRARRPILGAIWVIGIAVAGSYWYVKNLITVGNPLPGVQIGIGDVALPLVTPKNQCCPAADFITDSTTWHDVFLPGLKVALTPTWPLVLGLALLGGVLTLFMARTFLERVIGFAVLASAAGYAFTPLTAAGINRGSFTINLRYLAPALVLGCVLLPRCRLVYERGRWWLCSVPFLVAILFAYFARHYEHAPAWPVDNAVGVVFAIAVLAALLVLVVRGASSMRPAASRVPRPVIIGGAIVLIVAALWPLQRSYYDDRYRTLSPQLEEYNLPFNHLDHQRVALFGTVVQYGLLGPDLSNVVRTVETPDGAHALDTRAGRIEGCRAWRRTLRDEGYDYIVLLTGTFLPGPNPEPWVSTDPATTLVRRGYNSRVFRVDGELDPSDCPRAARATERQADESS